MDFDQLAGKQPVTYGYYLRAEDLKENHYSKLSIDQTLNFCRKVLAR
jgi:hypothetical protein